MVSTARMQPHSSACMPAPLVGLPLPVTIRTTRMVRISTPMGSSMLMARGLAPETEPPSEASALP